MDRAEGFLHLCSPPLRIETFYFFAQRCLDDAVALVDRFLAPAPIALGRHRHLKKNLTKLVELGHLPPIPPAVLETIDGVTRDVKAFRDAFIAHAGNQREPPVQFATEIRDELQRALALVREVGRLLDRERAPLTTPR